MSDQVKKTDSPVAVVTGGNSGIGEAISKMLGRRGYRVVIAGRRGAENERVARDISEAGPGAGISSETDVSRESECLELIRSTIEREGRLDLLVNNAGTITKGPLVESETETFDKVMKTNLYSTYWCSREAFRWMKDRQPASFEELNGRIINISSLCGVDAWAGAGIYAASKHGVIGLTRALADEGGEAGIRVAAICPAMVATPMSEVSGPEYIQPEDIATTVAYLLDLSPAAWPRELVVPRRGAD
jgi:3-oxoacyl-[acyl-carrier protein] reductase